VTFGVERTITEQPTTVFYNARRALAETMDADTLASINSSIGQRVSMAQEAAPIADAAQIERQRGRAEEDIFRQHGRALVDISRQTARAVEDLNINTGRSLADLDLSVERSIIDLEINHSRALTDLEINTERSFGMLNINTERQMDDLERTITGGFYSASDEAVGTMREMYDKLAIEHDRGRTKTESSFTDMLRQMGTTGEEEGESVAQKVIKGVAKGFAVFNFVRNLLTTEGGDSGDGPGVGDGYGISAYAKGGMHEEHVAQLAPAGAMRVWAEPETGGEAYIPLASNKRARSLAIWKETGKRLGVEHIDSLELSDGAVLLESTRELLSNLTEFGAAAVQKYIQQQGIGGGGSSSPGRWKEMWAVAVLHSDYRPGAITATGNPSYHGMERAIDISPRMDIFEWLKQKYGANTKELIFSPANERQVWNGREHMYSGITRDMHWDHIHWAMKRGGILNAYKDGGIATQPSLGLVGEGDNEAMIPLNRRGIQALSDAISSSGVSFVTQSKRDQAGVVAAPGHSNAEVVQALSLVAEAVQMQSKATGSSASYGPITVQADDPRDMERKLQQRAAYQRLTKPASAGR